MIGAIAGDVSGSVHEKPPAQPKDLPLVVPGSRFTDDTVLTVAVACSIRQGTEYAATTILFRPAAPRLASWSVTHKEAKIPRHPKTLIDFMEMHPTQED